MPEIWALSDVDLYGEKFDKNFDFIDFEPSLEVLLEGISYGRRDTGVSQIRRGESNKVVSMWLRPSTEAKT